MILPRPHICQKDLRQEGCSDGCRFVLASDGLWDAAGSTMCSAVWRKHEPENAPHRLLKMAMSAFCNPQDDVSILVVDCMAPDCGSFLHKWRAQKAACCTPFGGIRARAASEPGLCDFHHDSLAGSARSLKEGEDDEQDASREPSGPPLFELPYSQD